MQKNFLVVSEQFYSIQGEGLSVGTPAVFLRLSGCNLRCRGFSYQHPATQEHFGCDTTPVWKLGEKRLFTNIIAFWQAQGWIEKLKQGAHLVITGGEPLLQQPGLVAFLEYLDEYVAMTVYVEMETNATLPYLPELLGRIQQLNVSPKLSNSGELSAKIYIPEILSMLALQPNVYFKFVLMHPDDMQEVLEKYIEAFHIDPSRVWLMPEGGCSATIKARLPMVIELCKKYGMHLSPRLHILIWDQATGV